MKKIKYTTPNAIIFDLHTEQTILAGSGDTTLNYDNTTSEDETGLDAEAKGNDTWSN